MRPHLSANCTKTGRRRRRGEEGARRPGPEAQVLRHVLWHVLHNALRRVVQAVRAVAWACWWAALWAAASKERRPRRGARRQTSRGVPRGPRRRMRHWKRCEEWTRDLARLGCPRRGALNTSTQAARSKLRYSILKEPHSAPAQGYSSCYQSSCINVLHCRWKAQPDRHGARLKSKKFATALCQFNPI